MTSPNELDEWITVTEATAIMPVGKAQIQKLCRQYEESDGERGIKSKRVGPIWLVEKHAAEDYERIRK